MTDSTNNSFEEQWQNAFDDTELTPPESVWEKIELGLKPENMLPSKPNVGNKPYYFLGGIVVGLLSLFLWFDKNEKNSQIVEKQRFIIKNSNVKIKKQETIILAEKKEIFSESLSPLSVSPQITIKKKPLSVEIQTIATEEIPIRTLTDSVETIEPLTTKNIHSKMGNPMINLPTDQTPYYVKPPIKPQKKSIFKNVKISAGVGVYQ